MKGRFARTFWAGAAVLFAYAAYAQGLPPDCMRQAVPLTVIDEEWRLVPDLTVTQLRGKYRGKPVRIHSLNISRRTRRIALLVDASGSMKAWQRQFGGERKGKWELAVNFAKAFISTAPPETSLTIATFSTNASILFRPVNRQDVASPIAELERVEPKSTTPLVDAIMAALNSADLQSGDTVFVVTDGQENASEMTLGKAERELIRRGIRLSVFLTLDYSFPGALTPGDILRVARATGGLSAGQGYVGELPKSEVLSALSSRLHRLIVENYEADVEFAKPLDRIRSWKLELFDKNGRKLKAASFTYPRKLPSCRGGS